MKIPANGAYDSVMFHFFGGGENEQDLEGNVILRPDGMVLEIAGGDGPYLLVGKFTNPLFKAANSHQNRISEVDTTWSWLDSLFVGVWFEDNREFLFKFKLGARRTA